MKNPNQISTVAFPIIRRSFCTAAATTASSSEILETLAAAAAPPPSATTENRAGGKDARLYRRLSARGATGGTISETLNEFIREGRKIAKLELVSCIKELRRYQKHQHALQIMEWMEKRGIDFSETDFALRLDLIAKVKGIAEAEDYFKDASHQNRCTYGALLNCYCREAMEDKAIDLFQKMEELEIGFSTLAYNNLMSLYMKLGKPEKVPLIVDEMKKKNVPMQNFTYKIWMHSYSKLNDIEQVEGVLEEMKKDDKVKCDSSVYCSLAASYVNIGAIEKAKEALKHLEDTMDSRDLESYHFLISLNAKISELGEVKRVWNKLKLAFPQPKNLTYLTMLHALARLDDVQGMTECFEEWKSARLYHDMRSANTVIRVYLKHDMLKEAELVFEDAAKQTSGPLFTAREMFMSFYLKKSQMDLALKHMKEAISEVKGDRWRPSPEITSSFLIKFDEEGNTDGAEEFNKLINSLHPKEN